MKKIMVGVIVFFALLGTLSVDAGVIFSDTFDTPSLSGVIVVVNDLNSTDLVSRQMAGATASTYTLSLHDFGHTFSQTFIGPGAGSTQPLVLQLNVSELTSGDGFVAASTDTNFGPIPTNETWTLDFDSSVSNTVGFAGWSGFGVGVPDSSSGFGFIIYMETGVYDVYVNGVSVSGGNVGKSLLGIDHHLSATFDEVANTAQVLYSDGEGDIELGTYSTDFLNDIRQVFFQSFAGSAVAVGSIDWRIDNVVITGPTIQPPPIGDITIDLLSGTNDLTLTWATGGGFSYTVEKKVDLLGGVWATNMTGIAGTGGDITITTAVDQTESFYRVIAE